MVGVDNSFGGVLHSLAGLVSPELANIASRIVNSQTPIDPETVGLLLDELKNVGVPREVLLKLISERLISRTSDNNTEIDDLVELYNSRLHQNIIVTQSTKPFFQSDPNIRPKPPSPDSVTADSTTATTFNEKESYQKHSLALTLVAEYAGAGNNIWVILEPEPSPDKMRNDPYFAIATYMHNTNNLKVVLVCPKSGNKTFVLQVNNVPDFDGNIAKLLSRFGENLTKKNLSNYGFNDDMAVEPITFESFRRSYVENIRLALATDICSTKPAMVNFSQLGKILKEEGYTLAGDYAMRAFLRSVGKDNRGYGGKYLISDLREHLEGRWIRNKDENFRLGIEQKHKYYVIDRANQTEGITDLHSSRDYYVDLKFFQGKFSRSQLDKISNDSKVRTLNNISEYFKEPPKVYNLSDICRIYDINLRILSNQFKPERDRVNKGFQMVDGVPYGTENDCILRLKRELRLPKNFRVKNTSFPGIFAGVTSIEVTNNGKAFKIYSYPEFSPKYHLGDITKDEINSGQYVTINDLFKELTDTSRERIEKVIADNNIAPKTSSGFYPLNYYNKKELLEALKIREET
jgi:hypothetical protein